MLLDIKIKKILNMKQTLIRLTSNSNDGLFDCNFQDEIYVNPNSKLALQSLSLNKSMENITIDGSNDQIRFQIDQAFGFHTIHLNPALYTKNSLKTLFEEMTIKMNSKLLLSRGKEFGTQISCGITEGNRFVIDLAHSRLRTVNGDYDEVRQFRVGLTNSIQYLSATTASNDPSSNFVVWKHKPFIRGCGQCRMRIALNNIAPNTTAGMRLALVNEDDLDTIKLGAGQWNEGILAHSIFTSNINTGNYQYKQKNLPNQDTGISPEDFDGNETDRDVMAICLEEGKLKYKIYTKTTTHTVYSQDYNFETGKDMYCVWIIYGDASTSEANDCLMTETPSLETVPETDATQITLGAVDTPVYKGQDTIYNVIFGSSLLANFLGYINTELNPNQFLDDAAFFNGDSDLGSILSTNTFLVELLNGFQLESYDSFKGGRKNILSVVPKSENTTDNLGSVQYEPSNMNFITLNNKNTVSLRNIKARVVTNTYDAISADGNCEIVLLLQEN